MVVGEVEVGGDNEGSDENDGEEGGAEEVEG